MIEWLRRILSSLKSLIQQKWILRRFLIPKPTEPTYAMFMIEACPQKLLSVYRRNINKFGIKRVRFKFS